MDCPTTTDRARPSRGAFVVSGEQVGNAAPPGKSEDASRVIGRRFAGAGLRRLWLPLSACLAATAAAQPVRDLRLIKSLPVEGTPPAEPSGLTISHGQLYTVSDHQDDTIYRVKLEKGRAILEVALRFQPPPEAQLGKLDFEGITCDQRGHFYLASERHNRVLHVSPDARIVEWSTPSLTDFGVASGLFQLLNGGLEGIAYCGPDNFFLCAERQERGLLEVSTANLTPAVSAVRWETSRCSVGPQRPPDCADLYFERGTLYALARGAETVVLLRKVDRSWREVGCWSMTRTLSAAAYLYSDTRFGKAEGLCMDRKRVYVILDNNGEARQADPADRRSLLFVFQRP